MYESDEFEYAGCGWSGCGGEDPDDEQMGSHPIGLGDPSPYHAAHRFESDRDDIADLVWYETTDSVPFRGRIDEVALYKRTFDADEVTALYRADSLALHLTLDDPPGSTTFEDAAGKSDGSCTGDYCPTAGVPGRDNMALLFDGDDDYVEVELDVSETVYGLALWFKTSCADCGIFSVDDGALGSNGNDRHVYLSSGNLCSRVWSNETICTAGVDYADGNWHHVVHTFGGDVGGQQLYVDGVEQASGAQDSSDFTWQTGVNVGFSNDAGDPYFEGRLDDVRLYKRALISTEIHSLYEAAPQMLLLLDEDVGATEFEDATGNGHNGTCSGNQCPGAGAKGQLGLAAQFDGQNDYIEVPHSSGLMPDQELTLAAWVNMTASKVDQIIVGKSTGSDGYVLAVQDGELYPQIWDSTGGSLYSGQWGGITPGYWTHVAVTWETGGHMIGYVNGNEVGRVAASSDPIGANTNPLRVGIAPWSTSQYPANGLVDHVTLYRRTLFPGEVRQLYRFQAKWVEERQSTDITIDADAPRSILESDETYRPNRDAVQLVTAEDATSYVTMLEMGVSTDDGLSYTWETAPACEDTASLGAAWCPTFDPTEGEGRYFVQTRATDVLGNVETPTQTHTLLVDGTPPEAGTTMQEGEIVRLVPHPEVENAWLAPLHGTVTDPALVSGDPGSGVASVTVRMFGAAKLTDTLPMSATLNGGGWRADFEIPMLDPTGTYTVEAQTTDNVGNATDIVHLVNIAIDASPPEASLDPVPSPYTDTITSTLTFSGLVTETGVISTGIAKAQIGFLPGAQAALSGMVTQLHLNELPGAALFHNRADPSNPATCQGGSCPESGVEGVWGHGVSFDDWNDILVVNDVGQRLISGALSFGAWVYPEDYGALVMFNDQVNEYSTRVQIGIGYSFDGPRFNYLDHEAHQVAAEHIAEFGRWYHVMAVIDEDGNGTLYVDGKVEATFETTVRPESTDHLFVGDGLEGQIDEVVVYDGPFTAAEVYAGYADTTLADSGEGVLDTSWSYTGPEGLDGMYQINLYAEDVISNGSRPPDWNTGWRGTIDTRGPRVAVTVEETEMTDQGIPSFNTETIYTCWAQDFNLYVRTTEDDDTPAAYDFQCPCQRIAPHATVYSATFYHEVSPWYAATFTDTTRLYEYEATCTVPGLAVASTDMRACDFYGRCTEAIAEPARSQIFAPVDSSVLTPTHNRILTSTAPLTITGYAYARDRLKEVEVKVDNVLIDTHTWAFTPAVTRTLWSSPWTPTEGAHTLLSVATDHNNEEQLGELVRPVDVFVDTTAPTVDISPVVLTTTHRLGRGRVALTGQATDATSGMDHVEVQIEGGGWQRASCFDDRWRYEWYLGEDVAGEAYTVTTRATDMAGHSSRVTETVAVDLQVPNPITLTLTSDAQDIPPGTVFYTSPVVLDLSWVTSTDRTDLEYDVVWSVYNPDKTDHHIPPWSIPHNGPFVSQYTSGEGERIVPAVISRLDDGNRQRDVYGSIYVDSPLTPDYVTLQPADGETDPYAGWMEGGCSLVGIDRRVEGHAQTGAALAQEQAMYVSWDTQGLRLAWTGANWDYDGDLFIYLSTLGEGAATVFNPYTRTQDIDLNMVPVLDDIMGGFSYGIWVKDAQTAMFTSWDEDYWEISVPLLTRENYRFHEGPQGGRTDLYVPFDWIGVKDPILSPLAMVAFATEEDGLRLWATMPPANPVNSDLVVETGIFAGYEYLFGLMHAYVWPNLGPGVCPNRPGGFQDMAVDADLQFELSADPVGTTYGLVGDDLFWLQEQLMDPDRPADLVEGFNFMDTIHPPVGDGDLISYTIHYHNNGTVSSTVTATVGALFALQLVGGNPLSQTIPLGEIGPGENGTATFQGQVDLTATYSVCVTINPFAPELCEPLRDWASVRILVYDGFYGPISPLEWLSADHQVDGEKTEFLGILEPERFVSPGDNTFRGYAYDDSGVPLVRLETDSPYTITNCLDPTPMDGEWSCLWNATAVNGGTPPGDGTTFDLRLQAVDGHLRASEWTAPRTFIVDQGSPTVTFSAETTAAYSDTVVSDATLTFRGLISDTYAVGGVGVCLRAEGAEEACGEANLQSVGAATGSYMDIASVPLAVTGCDSGGIDVSFDVADEFEVGVVQLGINVDHERRNDISGTLTSPTGTQVQVLGADEGTPPVFQNLDVLLFDAATSAQHDFKGDDNTADPLFDREARPLDPMSVFRGEESDGTWTLKLCDTVPITKEGTYNQARLSLTPVDTSAQRGSWSYNVSDLGDMDNVGHTVTAVGTDLAGNQSEPISLTFAVDNVAPSVEVTETVTVTLTTPNRPPVRVLVGTAEDGGRIVQMVAFVEAPSGAMSNRQVARGEGDDEWWFELKPGDTGHYHIWVNAVDEAENSSRVGAYDVEIIEAPFADAGEDQTVGPGELVTLDGSGSYDSSGDPLTYGWSQTGGPAVALSDNSVVTPTFVAPLVSGPITFSLTVTNTSALTDTDSTLVTVASADLTLEKSASADTPREGERVVYVITVTNSGPDEVTGVVMSDTLPGGVTFDAHDGGYNEDSGEWTVATLAAGVSDTLRITVTVDPGTWGTQITNTAAITQYSPTDLTTDDHRAQTVIAAQHPDAVIITVTPEGGGTLIYVNEQGYTTTVEIPAGAVSETITIILTPLDGPTHPTAPWEFAGHAFTLEAYQGPYLEPGYVFQEPMSITIHYSDEDIAAIADEASLLIRTWVGGGWMDAACDGYLRNLEENWLSTEICHLSEFALLGEGRAVGVGGETLVAAPLPGLAMRTLLLALALAILFKIAASVVVRRE
ncbi:MAG: proprotein convertase P-domain-containing protein [Anaerolineae bacterium]